MRFRISHPSLISIADWGLPLLLGLLVFFIAGYEAILNPSYVAWLQYGDHVQQFYGTFWFSKSPFWQFPLGNAPYYGLPMYPGLTTIAYTGAVVFVAFATKTLYKIFPFIDLAHFQLVGLWVLLSFMLQALFSYKLLRFLTRKPLLSLLFSILIVLMPILLQRSKIHLQLVDQWLILASFYLILTQKKFRPVLWGLLLWLALASEATFFFMVGLLWFGDLLYRWRWEKTLSLRYTATTFVVTTILTTLYMVTIPGYFSPGTAIGHGGFGTFYSFVLAPFVDMNIGGGEAYGYLGAGMTVLFFMALGAAGVLYKFPPKNMTPLFPHVERWNKSFFLFFSILLIIFWIFAVLPSFYITSSIHLLPHTTLGWVGRWILSVQRSNGRWIWVPCYALALTAITLSVRLWKPKINYLLFVVVLLMQFPTWAHFLPKKNGWPNPGYNFIDGYTSSIHTVNTQLIHPDLRYIILVGHIGAAGYFYITAARVVVLNAVSLQNNLRINGVYWPRSTSLPKQKDAIVTDILHHGFRKDALYVVRPDGPVWTYAKQHRCPQRLKMGSIPLSGNSKDDLYYVEVLPGGQRLKGCRP